MSSYGTFINPGLLRTAGKDACRFFFFTISLHPFSPGSCVIPRVPAPGSNLGNERQRQIIRVWYLDGTFAVFIPVFIQLLRKESHCLRAGIKTDMLLLGCKMNESAMDCRFASTFVSMAGPPSSQSRYCSRK